MSKRVFNFSPGPAVLPLPVLEEVQRDMRCLPGEGVSVLEISHRAPWFDQVLAETEANLRKLLSIPSNYRVLFMQGGSRLQFAMTPMNLLGGASGPASYIVTGSWGKMAEEEARKFGPTHVAYSSKATNFDRLPESGELKLDPKAAYVQFTSNETIQGVQFLDEPRVGDAPLVCDASSDFLCRPLPMERYGLIYACAQKNSGPAGVTIAIIRDDLLERSSDKLPTMLNYKAIAAENSLVNTVPVFAIYVVMLVTRWLDKHIGGLDNMLAINRKKAKVVYDAVDSSGGFYQPHARKQDRSLMNVTFRMRDDKTQADFLKQAEARGLTYLKGHRSVGGVRASIYNAMPMEGVERLAEFMGEFATKAGR